MDRGNELLKESVVMANELDVAGEFIYAAIDIFNKMNNFDQVGDNFFLYHLAVGIERVQKILLVIINDVERDEIEDFLEKIKSHNHIMLHGKIKEKVNISFSKEQNDLLNLLSEFYNAERYARFNFFSYNFKDRDLLTEYVQKYCKNISFDYSLCKKIPLNTDEVKEFFGRVIGRLCQKYYKLIEEESRNRNIYCYELRYNSAAERVFCGNEDKGSYQKKIDKEKRAIKELLLYLRSPQEMNKFIVYINNCSKNYCCLRRKFMADKLEDLLKNAVQGKPYSGESNSNKADIQMDKPMTLKHSLDGALGKPMICNEGTDINNMNSD